MIADPGAHTVHGARDINARLSLSIDPQVGLGGGTPKPRKLNAVSVRITCPSARLASTITGDITFGSTWRRISRACEPPIARAASTYSVRTTDIVGARTIRAILGIYMTPMVILRT